MKKIDPGKAVALIANIGVIAGIFFLAFELRQNTGALQAQTRAAVTDNTVLYLGWTVTNPGLADIQTRVRSDGFDSLNLIEQRQFRSYVAAQARIWENTFYQYEQGLFTQPEYEARREVWKNRMLVVPESTFYRSFWAATSDRFSPTFRAEIEGILLDKVEQD